MSRANESRLIGWLWLAVGIACWAKGYGMAVLPCVGAMFSNLRVADLLDELSACRRAA